MSEYETLTTPGGAGDPLPPPPPPPMQPPCPLRSSDDVNLKSDPNKQKSLEKKSGEIVRKSCESTPQSLEQLKSPIKPKNKEAAKGKPKNKSQKSQEQTSNEKESNNNGLVRLLMCTVVLCSILLVIFTSFVLVIVGHLAGIFNFIPAFTQEESN